MKIVVLCGGISTERDISLTSGKGVYRALRDRHETVLLDSYLGYKGDDYKEVFSMDKDWSEGIGGFTGKEPDIAKIKAMRENPEEFLGPHVLSICKMADIVFLAMHGENGENGKLQALFDLYGVKYTGTDYLSSAIAMNKARTKELFTFHKVPTPGCLLVKKGEPIPKATIPCVVKASNGGSSIGVYIVKTQEEYENAMKEASSYDAEIVIEEFIEGREFTDCVIDGKPLPIVEITPGDGGYDYKNKYTAGAAREVCPAPLSEDETKRLQAAAVEAYHALGIKTYARFDFMMDKDGNFYCLEGNTLPGMTPTSLIPQEAAAIGVDYADLCEWIIRVSLAKYE